MAVLLAGRGGDVRRQLSLRRRGGDEGVVTRHMVQVVQRAEVAARQPITPRFCDSSTRVLIADYMEAVERERSW